MSVSSKGVKEVLYLYIFGAREYSRTGLSDLCGHTMTFWEKVMTRVTHHTAGNNQEITSLKDSSLEVAEAQDVPDAP
jgi:hypothetical protein